MAFCSECGNDIGTDKFCSECGSSNDGIKPKQDKKERDISKAIIHLKGLSNTRGNVIIPDDIKMYEEALNKISNQKFVSFTISLNRYKKVQEINRHLEIDQEITDKMLERANDKDFKKGLPKPSVGLGGCLLRIIPFILALFIGLLIYVSIDIYLTPDDYPSGSEVISNDDACDCLKSFVENNSSKQLSCVNEYYDSAYDYIEINYPNDRFQNQEAVLQKYFYDKCKKNSSSEKSDCITRDNNFIESKMMLMKRDVISIQKTGNRKYFVQYVDWTTGRGNSGSTVLDYSNSPCD